MTDLFHILPRPPDLDLERNRAIEATRGAAPHAEVIEVGSTAIPGLVGKQDIDLLVRVERHRFDETRAALDVAFERNEEQLSNDQYQGYRVASRLDIALQLTVKNGPHDTFVTFLEALRRSPALVAAYNELKRRWDGQPMDAYRNAKAAFIEEVLAASRE